MLNYLLLVSKTGKCVCDDKVINGFGNCQKPYSKCGRSGPICYVSIVNTCSRSFKGTKGWFSWDPCPNDNNTLITSGEQPRFKGSETYF